MKELEADPSRDVTTIKVDLRLSALKPVHANLMKDIYEHFKTNNDNRYIYIYIYISCLLIIEEKTILNTFSQEKNK